MYDPDQMYVEKEEQLSLQLTWKLMHSSLDFK